MRPRTSSLNPYAAAYVPIAKREANAGTSVTEGGSKNYDGTVWFQTSQDITMDRQLVDTSAQRFSPVKSQPASYYNSPPQSGTHLTDKQLMDEELDIDLEYLRMTFPGISDQSLVDVYNVNNGDLDAAIDMLSQLEFDAVVEPSASLPDTLDIGDVSDSVDSAPSKQKNVAAEASTSSSGHLASASVL